MHIEVGCSPLLQTVGVAGGGCNRRMCGELLFFGRGTYNDSSLSDLTISSSSSIFHTLTFESFPPASLPGRLPDMFFSGPAFQSLALFQR